MMPTWLQRHLENQTGAPLGARYTKPRLCPCGTWTLLGLDADTLAFTVRVDPTPLTTDGELTAILTGRPTYLLTLQAGATGGRLQLDHRDHYRMTGRPPRAGATYDVVPAHRCGDKLTAPLVTTTNLAPTCTHPATLTVSGRPGIRWCPTCSATIRPDGTIEVTAE